MNFIGLDLAWSAKNPTGGAALDADGRLREARLLTSDADILAFVDAHAPEGPALVAVDAPLSVPNETGRRPAEAALPAVFGRYQAGAHPANRQNLTRYHGGTVRGEGLKAALEARGFVDDPFGLSAPDARAVVEVYPHPAMVALFGLQKTLKYKNKGQGREVMDAAWREYHAHLAALAQAEPALSGLEALLVEDPTQLRGRALKGHEDRLDAVMCAYIAAYAHRFPERCEVFGTVAEGYILTPTFKERWRQL